MKLEHLNRNKKLNKYYYTKELYFYSWVVMTHKKSKQRESPGKTVHKKFVVTGLRSIKTQSAKRYIKWFWNFKKRPSKNRHRRSLGRFIPKKLWPRRPTKCYEKTNCILGGNDVSLVTPDWKKLNQDVIKFWDKPGKKSETAVLNM